MSIPTFNPQQWSQDALDSLKRGLVFASLLDDGNPSTVIVWRPRRWPWLAARWLFVHIWSKLNGLGVRVQFLEPEIDSGLVPTTGRRKAIRIPNPDYVELEPNQTIIIPRRSA